MTSKLQYHIQQKRIFISAFGPLFVIVLINSDLARLNKSAFVRDANDCIEYSVWKTEALNRNKTNY